MNEITDVKGLLIDLEGVLYSDNKLISGSIEAIKEFRKNNLKLRFLTNTTTTPRNLIFNKLLDFGFNIKEEEIRHKDLKSKAQNHEIIATKETNKKIDSKSD